MIRTRRVEHQAIIGIGSVDPSLYEVYDIQSEHAISLFRQIGKVRCAAIEITPRRGPGIPGHGAFIPIGGYSINISGLTCLISTFI